MSLHFLFYILLGILVIIFLLIGIVLYYSFSQFRALLALRLWGNIIDEKIAYVIIYGAEGSATESTFAANFHNIYFKKLFLEKLVAAERKFAGTAKQELKLLYEKYELKTESLKKLHQKKPHLLAGGLQELTAMEVEEALPKITAFLTHPSPLVYEEAQYASVHFRGFEGLYFLSAQRTAISDWQQLRLLLAVPEIPEQANDFFQIWLESTNSSVLVFTLRLIRKFKFLPAEYLVQELWSHPSEKVRVEMVKTLHSLENTDTNRKLMDLYPTQPPKVQLEIIRVLLLSKDSRCRGFFEQELIGHSDPALKIEAAKALVSLGCTDELRAGAADMDTSPVITAIINHALENK